MINMKHLLLLLALGGLGASCTNDDLTDGSNPIAGRTELQIAFSGSGESQEYTRAIASENENTIGKLEVYLFAAASQGGPFYYVETWEEGTAFNPVNPSTDFQKQASGTGWKATLYPEEQKGLPWIKLMCVANNGATGSVTTDGKFHSEGGAAEVLTTLTKVTVDADGNVTNAGAATTEADFRDAYTAALGDDAATGLIGHIDLPNKKIAPLLMTGEGITKISGSVSKVDISLKRAMARFDIENNMATSSLTIEEVSLVHGRKNASLWGVAPTAVVQGDLATSPLLHTYPAVEFSKIPNANHGMLESAYYVYPGLATDESYLIVKGKYKSPVTSALVDVTYNVPIVRTPEGAAQGEYIPLKANSRYKLRITDVSESNVFGSFEVVDWTSGGGITIRPDNDAPVFDASKAFDGANDPTALTGPTVLPNAFEVVGETGAFNVTIAATGKVRAEKEQAAIRAITNDWLSISLTNAEERDGVWYTTFKMEYSNAIGQQPIAVHFINETASFDPALWTTVNFYGPKAVPNFAVVATGGASKGNVTDGGTDGKAPTASLYKLNGSFVKFDVTCLEGLAEVTSPTGYTVTKEKTEGTVHTYKIAVSDAANAADGTIVFKNAGDETKTTTLTLKALEPAMEAEEVTDAGNVGSGIESGILKIDLDALTSYTFKVNAPQGLTASVNLATCPWLTITESHAWADTDGNRYAEYTVTPKANPMNTDDVALVFTNALTETGITAPDLTITLHKDFSKPKFAAGTTTASWSDFNTGLASDFTTATAATITMHKVNGSAVTVNMTCAEAAAFEAVSGLTVTQISSTDEYIIAVTDATQFTNATTVVTAKNTPAAIADASTDRKATLTITWKSAAIEVDLTNDDGGLVVKSTEANGDIVFTVDIANLSGTGFIFGVTAGGGAATDLSVLSGTFLKKHLSNTGTDALTADVASTYQFRVDDDTQSADITLTFTNTVTGGGDQKIIFKKKL